MDYPVLAAICGAMIGGVTGLFAVGLAGCIMLASNARGLSELT